LEKLKKKKERKKEKKKERKKEEVQNTRNFHEKKNSSDSGSEIDTAKWRLINNN